MPADLNEPITYRGFLLNDPDTRANIVAGSGPSTGIRGCVVDFFDLSDLDVVQFREKRSQSDGMDAGAVFLGARRLRMNGTLYGTSRAEFFEDYQNLRAALNATLAFRENPDEKGYLPLYFSTPTTRLEDFPDDSDGSQSVIRKRLVALPQVFSSSADRDQLGGNEFDALAIPWSAVLYCRNPIIQGAEQIVYTFAGTEDTSVLPVTGEADTDILTSAGHGYIDGDAIQFTQLVGGTGLLIDTTYYVLNATTDTFQVSLSPGGVAVDFTVDVTSAIHTATVDELTRLTPDNIFVAGNEVSDATVADLAAYTAGVVTRESGGTKSWTMARTISRSSFSPGVAKVFIASAFNYADCAMAAVGAIKSHSPLLLAGAALPTDTATELARLNPVDITIVGSPTDVPAAVMTAMAGYPSSPPVVRIYGATHYKTAIALSQSLYPSGATNAFIVPYGTDCVEAQIAAALTSVLPGPLLFVQKNALGFAATEPTAVELDRLNLTNIYILSVGPDRISSGVQTALAAYGSVTRYEGADKYELAAVVSADWYDPSQASLWVHAGRLLNVAACAAAAAGSDTGSFLYVASATANNGQSSVTELVSITGTITNRGDYHVPADMLFTVSGAGAITVSVGDSTFTLIVEESTGTRIYRIDGEEKTLHVEEDGVNVLRMDLIVFEGANTWPLIPAGDSSYSITLAGVSLVSA